ncbi:16055_t:CDS:2, partial [Racocetra fulgida]
TFYVVNVQTNISYMIDTETNALCENTVHDKATNEKDDVDAYFKAYGLYHGFDKVLHSNGSLCNLMKTLDSQLEKEAEWNHFFEYQTLSLCIEITSISKYLTSQILSIEYIEMAQCLYFNATLVDLTVIGLDNKNENLGDQFMEDVYDAKQILFKSIVSK